VRHLNRQGRTALLWGLASFAALQALLAAAIELRFPELRDPEFGRKATRLAARTSAAPRPYTVLMLGSSRVLFGFDAGRLEGPIARAAGRPAVVYNFGLSGAGPLAELLTLRRLLARGARPDLLLVEAWPPQLCAGYDERDHFPALRLWRDDLPLLERYGAPAARLWADWWAARPVPCYAHRFAILSRLLPALLPDAQRQDWAWGCDDAGWVRAEGGLTPEQRRAGEERGHGQYAALLADFRPGGPACRALRELLEVCRRERIPVALVVLPEASDFRALYPPQARERADVLLADLAREHGVPVLDARAWVPDECFWDSHHLGAAGAAAFTEQLGRLLVPHISTRGAADEVCCAGPCQPQAPASGSAEGAGRSAARGTAGPCQLPASGTQVEPP
jgi:hypothetical protein